jgi:hypothetical protein
VKTRTIALVVTAVLACAACNDGGSAAPVARATVSSTGPETLPPGLYDEAGPDAVLDTEAPVPGRPIAPPVPSSEPVVRVDVGQTATLRGVDVTVTDVTFDPCLGDYMQAGPGMTYLFADATMTNRAYPGTANYGSFDWVLTDGTGETYQSLLGLPCRKTDDDAQNDFLNQGVTVRFRMAYEVPGSARGLVLQWDGTASPDEPEVARVLIDVGE